MTSDHLPGDQSQKAAVETKTVVVDVILVGNDDHRRFITNCRLTQVNGCAPIPSVFGRDGA
jgi:hypothetical protein